MCSLCEAATLVSKGVHSFSGAPTRGCACAVSFPDCQTSLANAIQVGQATWAVWAAVREITSKALLTLRDEYVNPYIPTQNPEED